MLNISRLKNGMAFAFALTFTARSIAAIGSLLLIAAIGNIFGASGVGIFAIAQSLILGAGLFSQYGMNSNLMRYVGEHHQSTAIFTYLRWAIVKSITIAMCISFIAYFMRYNIAALFDDIEELSVLLQGAALAIPAFTASYVISGFLKGIRRPAAACLQENGSIALVTAAIIVALSQAGYVDFFVLGSAIAAAAWIVLLQGVLQISVWTRKRIFVYTRPTAKKNFSSSAKSFLIINFAPFLQQGLVILVAGLMLENTELGLLRASERAAILISFVLIVVNAVLAPRFSSLYYNGEIAQLGALARKGSLFAILIATPIFSICIFNPQFLLNIIGPEFKEGADLLRVIAFAQIVNVAAGSVGVILNMTGHEKTMRNIALLYNISGVLSLFITIPMLGTIGASISIAFILIFQNLTAAFFVWKKLGISLLPRIFASQRIRSKSY